MAEEIETIFPNEKAETYYVPYSPGGKSKKRQGPKGKLWSRYVNVRSALRHANSFKESKNQKENKSPKKDPIEIAHLDFLKVATKPYTKIIEAWEQTFKLRKRLYLNADLEKIFQDFPCLKLNSGIELVRLYFILLFFLYILTSEVFR